MKTLLFILLVSTSFYSNAQFTVLDVPESGRYDDVFFYNDTLGWACNLDGDIFKTRDGLNWDLYYSTGKYLRCIEFATPYVGFAGSLEEIFYKTIDGGATWTPINQTISQNLPGVCGLAAPSENVIYGCGIWSSPAFIIKSIDGGMNWEFTDMSAYASALVDIYFIDETHGFAAGKAIDESEGGIVLYTDDGGETWSIKLKTMVAEDYIWKIQTPDGIHFWGSVEGLPQTGNVRLVKSSDSGNNWTQQIIHNNYIRQQMIGFLDENHGFTGSTQSLLETVDGGNSWTIPMYNGTGYNRFFRISDSLAYMSGEKLYRYSLHGELSVNEEIKPSEIHVLSVNPNPTEQEITISLELNTNTFCQMDLYQADGKLVQNIISEKSTIGKKEWKVFIGNINPQQLFLVMKTNEGTIHRSIVKQ